MEIKKNEEYIVDIIDNGMEGEGIAKIDDLVIFIPGDNKKRKNKNTNSKSIKKTCIWKNNRNNKKVTI